MLSAVLLRVRQWGRSTGRRAALVALIIGVIAGAVLSVASGARRTASVPDRYTEALGGEFDLVLFQYAGAPLTEAISELPGVAHAEGATFTAAWPITANFEAAFLATLPFAGDSQTFAGLVLEGRYADPRTPDEFTVNRPLADLLDAKVGDRLEIAAFDNSQMQDSAFDGTETPGVGTIPATLVGITVNSGEFEDQTPQIVYSGALLADHPDIGVVASFILVNLDPGTDADAVLASARQLPGGEGLQRPADTQQVSTEVRRGVHFVSVGLWVVAGVGVIGAGVAIALLVTQLVGATREDRRTLRAIGWGRRDFIAESLLESAAIAVGATVVASVLVFATSGLFPFGAPRILEPNPGVHFDATVIGLGGIAILSICTLAALANEVVHDRSRSAARSSKLAQFSSQPFWSLPTAVGIRFALEPPPRRRTAWTTLAPGVIGCASLVAAMTVGLSMERVVDEPGRRGVNFDYGYGNQFIAQDADIVTPALDDPHVKQLTAATIGTLTIDDTEVQVLAFEPVRGSLSPQTLDGRDPIDAKEIGLGGEVARRIGKQIGDTVQVIGTEGDQRDLTVVGIVMTPYDAGGGAVLTYEGYAVLVPDATKNLLLVDFADDVGPDASAALKAATNTQADDFSLLPTSIGSLKRVVPMPFLLAGILSLLGAAVMIQALGSSVWDRRRDFEIIRALGGVKSQLRGILHGQATTVAVVIVSLGFPLGLFGGRRVFAAVADSIGVDSTPLIAWVLAPVLVSLVLLLTNAVVLVSGARARRTPILDLGSER